MVALYLNRFFCIYFFRPVPSNLALAAMPQGPITIYISRRFKPGKEEAVAQWAQEIRECCSTFPGFLGSVALEPHGEETDTCQIMFRFSNFTNLKRWEESPERAAFYERLRPLLEEEHTSRFSGNEPWFPMEGIGNPSPPPRWKMCLMALLAVFPCVVLVRYCTYSLITGLPLVLEIFISCIPVSILMSYCAMPLLTRIFQGWLYPRA